MINLPCNAASMSQVTPCQNVPVQTSQYNFPTCQQQQTNTQQMQTAACGPCFGISQDVQGLYNHAAVHQCTPIAMRNPYQAAFQSPCGVPPTNYPNYVQLLPNILDDIRACVSNASPIFILPGNCQQSPVPQQQQQQQPALPQALTPLPATAYPTNALTYPTVCYPPPIYPYPVPLPFCDTFIRAKETTSCGCCRKKDVETPSDARQIARAIGGCHYETDQDEHHCTPTVDDTICSKRNCPSSLHLQALASQFLSMQGIISCAATRLVLRKVPGSNVTTTMEDTIAKAQKAISALTKDQLLSESRIANQVNALINLHMTANPPPNIIPILTLVQLKLNLLKAQVEGLVNRKLMETQGVGVEVEIDLIDPTILALKSDAELRDFLSALRQKECDERVNVNFAPYRSQRAIAETRLSNVQNKIRQVEAEFDRRRCAMLPSPTLSSRIVQQFSAPCHSARFEDSKKLYRMLPPDASPDPFVVKTRSPRRLLFKTQCTTRRNVEAATQAAENIGTVDSTVRETKPSSAIDRHSSTESCTCNKAKKKLRSRIAEMNNTTGNCETMCVRTVTKCRVRKRETRISSEKVPRASDAEHGLTSPNVISDKSAKTLMESESDTIIHGEKIDAEDVCESLDAIAIRNSDRIIDREESGGSTDLRQTEERVMVEITISERMVEEEAIEAKKGVRINGSQGVPSSETEREEAKATTTAKVADDDRISTAWKTEQMSSVNIYTSSPPRITLTQGGRKLDHKYKSLLLSLAKITEQSANELSIKFYTALLLINIAYDQDCECQVGSSTQYDNDREKKPLLITCLKDDNVYLTNKSALITSLQ